MDSLNLSTYKPYELIIALGVVYGAIMSWDGVVETLVQMLPSPNNQIAARIFYAVIITIIAMLLLQFFDDRDSGEKNNNNNGGNSE